MSQDLRTVSAAVLVLPVVGYRLQPAVYRSVNCLNPTVPGFHVDWASFLECEAPSNVTNGIVLGTEFSDHHWVAFQCLPGYQLNGSSHAVCRCSNSSCSWSSPPPTCIELGK